MIKGETVTLYEKVKIGVDGLNHPIYNEVPVNVSDILIAPASSVEVLSQNDLDGAHVEYQLAIPKKDTHNWSAGSRVDFFGEKFRTVGIPTKGIDENIPLMWNMKVMVERYE